MSRVGFLIILNLPILQEVIRKYFIPNDLVFLSADAITILSGLILMSRGRLNNEQIPRMFWVLSFVVILWTLFIHLMKGRHLGIYGIGLRTLFLPIFYLLISCYYVHNDRRAAEKIFYSVNFWIIIIGLMAFVQLSLGKSHPINAVWGQSGLGVGDFATHEKGVLIPGLFRPTSIFMHTGKFGQVAFTLILFKWCYLAFCGKSYNKIFYLLILFDMAVIFSSGQRAAVVFLLLSVLLMFYFFINKPNVRISKFIHAIAIAVFGSVFLMIIAPDVALAIFERFYSAVESAPLRLKINFLLPMGTILDNYLLYGEGLGFFTFGSHIFGGTLAYKYVDMAGLGESSLIRLCSEVGVICALIVIVAYFSLVAKSLRKYRLNKNSEIGAISLFFFIWILCLVLWCNTADVFANSVNTTLGYALSGAFLVKSRVWKKYSKVTV